MNKITSTYLFVFSFIVCVLFACNSKTKVDLTEEKTIHLVYDIPAVNENGELNVVIEIPAGTIQKWEVNKKTGQLDIEKIDGKIRKVDYLPYPGNYGMIPQTILPKALGGDGDPLDILILGPAAQKGSIVNCKIIGVLKLLDRGEQDDKLIAVQKNTKMYRVNDMNQLDSLYPGVSETIFTWFTNYKGPGKMQSQGFGKKEEAENILNEAIKAYKNVEQ